MGLTDGVSSVVTVVVVMAVLMVVALRRRALAAGRDLPMSRAIGAAALVGGCGALAGALVVIAVNAALR